MTEKEEIAALKARIAALEKGTLPAEKREKEPLAPEHKGTKSYVSSTKHYRDGRLYEPGQVITVTDEKPGKDWVLYEAPVAEKKAHAAPAHGGSSARPSDKGI